MSPIMEVEEKMARRICTSFSPNRFCLHERSCSHTHMGTPPPGYNQEWVTHTVHWHGFPSLSLEQGESVDSPKFMLLGNQWFLAMFPGGDVGAAEGMVSLSLWNMSDKAIDIDYGFSVNDENGKQVAYERTATPRNFAPMFTVDGAWGLDFVKRSKLMNSLVNGTLVIGVHMRLALAGPLNDKYSDIIFEVAEGEGVEQCNKGRHNCASFIPSSSTHHGELFKHTC